jgi:uncharacterized protein (DUF58 family)
MTLNLRSTLLLLFAAPLFAAGAWLPGLEGVAAGYVLLCLALLALDWRLAEGPNRFQAAREHDTKLSLGADNPVRLRLHNRSRHPAQFWLRDEPPDGFRLPPQIFSGRLAPLGDWQTAYHVHPRQRGNFAFGALNLRWEGPLGLVRRQGRFWPASPVKVYPDLLEVRRYDLLLRQNRLQELGLRHSRHFGEGSEFERLREYLPDDEFRRINWKATARRLRPVTVEYQTERSQNVMVVLDTGRMMQSPVAEIAKLDYVINAVLLLAYVVTGKGDKVGLLTFADEATHYLQPRAGRGQFYRMLEALYAVKAQPVEPDYHRALSYLALKQRKRALVVIFTDLSGGLTMQSLVSQVVVLGRHHLPLVVTISDPALHSAAQQRPQTSLGVYQRATAEQLLEERRMTLDHLRRHGVLTLDVSATQLSLAVINRYLELKARSRL